MYDTILRVGWLLGRLTQHPTLSAHAHRHERLSDKGTHGLIWKWVGGRKQLCLIIFSCELGELNPRAWRNKKSFVHIVMTGQDHMLRECFLTVYDIIDHFGIITRGHTCEIWNFGLYITDGITNSRYSRNQVYLPFLHEIDKIFLRPFGALEGRVKSWNGPPIV